MSGEHDQVPVIRGPGEGITHSILGVEITFKAVSEETGGKYACYEYVIPPGFGGPPPHTHPGFDEFFYVLEGEMTFRAGEQSVTATTGTFLHVPGATLHGFANPGSSPTKFLGLLIPGGFERYFAELPAIIAQHGYPPPPAIMQGLSQKYGINFSPGG